jgi:hypothetical protein
MAGAAAGWHRSREGVSPGSLRDADLGSCRRCSRLPNGMGNVGGIDTRSDANGPNGGEP